MLLGNIPPEVKFDRIVLLELDRFLEGEKDGEPGEHAGGVGGGEDGDHDVLVQETLKVASKPMQDTVRDDLEAELFITGVVDDTVMVGMNKGEQRLRRGQFKAVLQ